MEVKKKVVGRWKIDKMGAREDLSTITDDTSAEIAWDSGLETNVLFVGSDRARHIQKSPARREREGWWGSTTRSLGFLVGQEVFRSAPSMFTVQSSMGDFFLHIFYLS